MEVLRARTAGFCMGVSLALQKLDAALGDYPEKRKCTLGPLIHNPQVLADYAARGVVCLDDTSPAGAGDCVVIRAHGIPREQESRIRESGALIVDATCPKVKRAQLAIARATREGAPLFLFGEADHPEVRGLVSYANGQAHVFGSLEELALLPVPSGVTCVLASQTTQDRTIFEAVCAHLQERVAAVSGQLTVLATICDATRERQEEARAIAGQAEAMVVVGGRQSGNTRRLADVAAACGIPTYHVETADELEVKDFAKKSRVALTAGASTPKSLIDAAEEFLRGVQS